MGKIVFFILFVFGLISSSFAEDITITTYYPSPYGSYNSLQADRIGVGDNNASGSLTSADVPTTSGHMWIRGNVGIGTTSPLSRLSVGTSGNSGYAIAASGSSTGIYGSGGSTGVYGTGSSYGVHGYTSNGFGVYGINDRNSAAGGGVRGDGPFGVVGDATNYTVESKGVYGIGNSYGVIGESNNGYGVWGWSDRGTGVYGVSNRSVGIYGTGRTYAIQGVGGNYGVVGSGTTAAFYATSGGYRFSDGTTQTTAASSSTQACTLCNTCGGSWPNRTGRFSLGNNQDISAHGDYCSGGLSTRHSVDMCCK